MIGVGKSKNRSGIRNVALVLGLGWSLLASRGLLGADQVTPAQDAPKGGNDQPVQGPASPSAAQTVEEQPLPAEVIEVSGTVEWAPPGASPLAAEGWTTVKVGDKYDPGTLLRTGLRSYVNLQFGQTSYISLRSVTYASIDQLYRSATAEFARVGLAYGTVRGSSSEGELRADVVVDSPRATLAKRGTEGWQIEVEPYTGRFTISLSQSGLVEAIQKLGADRQSRRTVRPGEYANERNVANLWIKQAVFDRNVKFFQSEGLTQADSTFSAENSRGYAVVAPGGGSELPSVAQRADATFIRQQLDQRQTGAGPTTVLIEPGIIRRPEGNFGTGDVFRVSTGRSGAQTRSAGELGMRNSVRRGSK